MTALTGWTELTSLMAWHGLDKRYGTGQALMAGRAQDVHTPKTSKTP
jgi:hypothetical protein